MAAAPRAPRAELTMATPVYDSAFTRNTIAAEARILARYRPLLLELISRNIKTRYKRSVLGVAWTMLNPLLTMVVLTVVFSQLFAFRLPLYPVYLLSGLLVWNFFSQSTVAAINELVWSSSLLKRIYVPRTLFAVAAVGTALVNVALALVPLGIIMLATGAPLRPALLFLPVALALAGLFALGVGLALSALAVFFADVVDMYQIVLVAWMYLTPIFYPPEILADNVRWLLYVNPMFYILECFRAPIYAGELPAPGMLLGATLSALVAVLFGGWFFARKSDDFTYYV
ncbi:MAG: ABC transporter permease [Anaerolineales bacterium]